MNAACIILMLACISLTPSRGQYGPLRKPKKHFTTTPFPIEDGPGILPDSNTIVEPQQPQQNQVQSQSYWWQSSNNPFSGPAPNQQPPYQVNVGGNPYKPEENRVPCNSAGYVCVTKHLCRDGVVVDNGEGIFQVRSENQYCNAASQVCCQLPANQPQSPQLIHGTSPQQQQPSQPTLVHGVVPSRPGISYGGNPQSTVISTNLVGPTPSQPDYQTSGSFAASQYYKPIPGTNGIPIGGSIYDHSVVTKYPDIKPYTGPLNTTPHPGCAAALKCVQEIYCTAEGVMSDNPVQLTREQYENKVPLSDCADPDTGIIGKCCRDPNYKDPWPGGMMMMTNTGDHGQLHTQTHTHTQPDECGPSAACVHTYQCSNQRKIQPIRSCRVPLDGASGVCCGPDQPLVPSASHIPPVSVAVTASPSPNTIQTYYSSYQTSTSNPFLPQPGKPQPYPQPPKPPAYPLPPAPQPFPQQPPTPQPFPQQPPTPQPFPQQPPTPQPFPQQPPTVQPFPQKPPTYQPFPQQPPTSQPFPQQPPTYQPFPQKPPVQPFPQKPPTPQLPQQPFNPQPTPQPFPQIPQQPANPQTFPSKPITVQPLPPQNRPPSEPIPKPSQNYPAPIQIPPQRNPTPGEACGQRRQVPRNGLSDFDAAFGEFPWQALVFSAQNESALCSAAIIAKNAVVTSAHCVQRVESRDLVVKAGVWKIRSSSQPKPIQVSSVAAIARHPHFDSGSLFNDLAVLFLAQDFVPDQHVDTICLPSGKQNYPQNTCVATGWGKNALQGLDSDDILHQIPVRPTPSSQCQDTLRASYLGRYFILNESFRCASPLVRETDLCKVGVGGPLACEPGDGRYVLSGIYSWDVGCGASNYPAVFSEIDVEWINGLLRKPVSQLAQDELNEILRQQQEDQQALQGVDVDSKPGFSQGYGK